MDVWKNMAKSVTLLKIAMEKNIQDIEYLIVGIPVDMQNVEGENMDY